MSVSRVLMIIGPVIMISGSRFFLLSRRAPRQGKPSPRESLVMADLLTMLGVALVLMACLVLSDYASAAAWAAMLTLASVVLHRDVTEHGKGGRHEEPVNRRHDLDGR